MARSSSRNAAGVAIASRFVRRRRFAPRVALPHHETHALTERVRAARIDEERRDRHHRRIAEAGEDLGERDDARQRQRQVVAAADV